MEEVSSGGGGQRHRCRDELIVFTLSSSEIMVLSKIRKFTKNSETSVDDQPSQKMESTKQKVCVSSFVDSFAQICRSFSGVPLMFRAVLWIFYYSIDLQMNALSSEESSSLNRDQIERVVMLVLKNIIEDHQRMQSVT